MKSTGQTDGGAARPGALVSIFQKRCSRCRRGLIFQSLWKMNENCPLCGLDFDRGDPGYFTGAMYASYAMAIPLIALLTLIAYLIFPKSSLFRLVMLASAVSTPLIPWIWQYSRVVWIYFDRYFDPEGDENQDPGARDK
jgi:uncharacterized protein (DUF983 family)